MFRFTIRDLLWLTVVIGVALGWLAEHRWVTTRTLHDKFTIQADRWEAFCDEVSFSSNVNRRDHDSFRKLVKMGDDIIPFVFERWPERHSDPVKWLNQPPWWYLLEDITGKKFVNEVKRFSTHEEFLKDVQDNDNPVGDDELKWRKWWNSESKGDHDVEQPRRIIKGTDI